MHEEERQSRSPRDLDMTLLHENAGILLHADPEVSDRNVRSLFAIHRPARSVVVWPLPCLSSRLRVKSACASCMPSNKQIEPRDFRL